MQSKNKILSFHETVGRDLIPQIYVSCKIKHRQRERDLLRILTGIYRTLPQASFMAGIEYQGGLPGIPELNVRSSAIALSGKIHVNVLLSWNNNSESRRKCWYTSFRVDITWCWNMVEESKHWVDVRNFHQSHVLYNHCIVSFALHCHWNTENSCQCVVQMLWAIKYTKHPCCSHSRTSNTWTHQVS